MSLSISGSPKKSGAWYTYEGEQLGQGRENAKQFLRDSPELMVELHQRIQASWSKRRPSPSRRRSGLAVWPTTMSPSRSIERRWAQRAKALLKAP